MRRSIAAIAVVLVVGLPATSVQAVNTGNFAFPSVIDDDQRKATARAFNCKSGPGFTAKVRVSVRDGNTGEIKRITKLASDTGTTRILIRTRKFDPGSHKIAVKCIHKFADGTSGTWYKDRARFLVTSGA